MLEKRTPEYVVVDPDFKPLPKHGHLSAKTPEYAAAESAFATAYSMLWKLPDWNAFREMAGDPDVVMLPGGPDRYKDVVTELVEFPARDGHLIELKIYKSPHVKPDATLMYRMHGGGEYSLQRGHRNSSLIRMIGWAVGRHEVDGAENVYAATNPNIVVVSVDYRKYEIDPIHKIDNGLADYP